MLPPHVDNTVFHWTSKFCESQSTDIESCIHGGAWVAQSVKCPALDFSSGHNLTVVRSSPEIPSPSPSAPPCG